jgi:thymidylate synthase (FAD)
MAEVEGTRRMKIIEPSFTILDAPDGRELLAKLERYGRTCYKSEGKATDGSAEKFIRMLLQKGHESVLEHEKVTVLVVCDRGVSHEIVRHRIASYSQESTRYCDYGKAGEIQVIEPKGLSGDTRSWWLHAVKVAEEAYNGMRRDGASPQIARSVLPNALKTEIVITYNIRQWRHFFRLRTAPPAHPQMREITVPMLAEFKRRFAVLFEDL